MAIPFPEIDPVALAVGPFAIRWYALAYLGGFVLGWIYSMRLCKTSPDGRPKPEDIENILPWLVFGVILGGRLGYVLFYNPMYYLSVPWQIPFIWQGGMSFHGGLAGVAAVIVWFSRRNNIPVLAMGDVISAAAPIGLFLGRIANFINGELYGRVTDVPWGFVFPGGGDLPRHPSQLYEAVLEGLVLFVVLHLLIRRENIRRKHGFVFGALLLGYALARFMVEFVREPDVQLGLFLGHISMGQILCLPMMAAGVFIMRYAVRKHAERD